MLKEIHNETQNLKINPHAVCIHTPWDVSTRLRKGIFMEHILNKE
jgi:hypothetical protein